MKLMKLILVISAVIFALAACSSDEGLNNVTIGGSVTSTNWTTGVIEMLVFLQGDDPGPTGEIGSTTLEGTGATTAYSMFVPMNSGTVYVFAFNDADGNEDPGTSEDGGCSSALNVQTANWTGVDLTLTTNGACQTSP